jgi:hypothetical protein
VSRPFVDFYRENAISPVGQDIADLRRHFERRDSLYRTMGIPSLLLRDRDVLEFGPGSGHNALHTATLGLRSYTLVDGNAVGLAEARRLFAAHEPESNVRFVDIVLGRASEPAPERSRRVVAPLGALREHVAPISPVTADALGVAVDMFATQSFERFAAPSAFLSFFGRAQQHVTFVRRARDA